MLEKLTLNRKNIFNLIKFVGAVLIMFFGLKLYVYDSGERVDFLNDTYFDNVLPSATNYDDSRLNGLGMHNISVAEQAARVDIYTGLNGENHEYELKYQTLCFSNFDICMKVNYVGNFAAKDKFMYLASVVYVLNTIMDNIQIGLDFNEQLNKITLNSEYGSTRGSANRNSVTLNLGAVASYVEYLGLISHELGHVVDLGIIRGYSSQKDPNFTEFGEEVFSVDDPSLQYYALSWESETVRKSEATREDFCSGYGMTDPFEDFAECHNMYLNHNEIFKQWAKINNTMKQKYNFFANLYNGKYMFSSSSDLVRFQTNSSWRPWDTTKM